MNEKGSDAFSIRDLGKFLGVYPTAIYHHVTTKNDLLSEVVSYALRDLEPPPLNHGWQEWIRELFIRYRAAVHAHPVVAPLIGTRIISSGGVDSNLIEHILATLLEAGFDDDTIVEAFNVVIAAMVGFVTQELARQPDDHADLTERMKTRINTVNVGLHPLMARFLPKLSNRAFILRWENGSAVPLDSSFEAYVDVVIFGLEQLILRRSIKTVA